MTLNKELALKWADELPNRTKGKLRLRHRVSDGVYRECCLGVLCDMVKDDVGGEWAEEYQPYFKTRYEDEANYLPFSVMNLIGLDRYGAYYANPLRSSPSFRFFYEEKSYESLSELNDKGNAPFTHIADEIRRLVAETA